MKKVLVVGAGMGGLSAAIRLQKEGFQVEIYEQQHMLGGKMHQIHKDGFTFDVGPTLVMMPEVYEDVFRDAGKDPKDYLELIKLDPMYDVYFKGEPYRHYSVNSDLKDLMKMVEKKGPENARGFLKYLDAIYERYQVALEHFIRRPFRHKKDMYNPFMLRQAMKLKTFDSADKMMSSFMPDKDLQQMFSFQTLYIGVSPTSGPSLYNIIPMIELFYGVWSFKGGMHQMARSMAKDFEELGGKIHYGKKVEKIITKKQEALGLWVDGKGIPGDIILCNADFPYAMKHLIDEPKVRGEYAPEKIEKMDYSCSCLVFYWGVDGTFDLEGHTFIVSEDLHENMDEIFSGELIKDPSVYLSIPSKIDPSMAPEGKSSFYLLIPVSELGTTKYTYDEKTLEYYREKALEALAHLPGLENLREKILFEEVFTPETFKEAFSAHRGATFGLRPTLLQSNHFRPQSKCLTCEGLYFTGSSTHPGAGVPIAIEGGRICAEEVLLDEGLR